MSDPIPAGTPAQFRSLFRSLVLDPALLLGRVFAAEHLAVAVAQEVGTTCDRIFTPLVTVALFLSQVLSVDHSCRGAVARLLAWRSARGLPACSPDSLPLRGPTAASSAAPVASDSSTTIRAIGKPHPGSWPPCCG